MKVLTKVSSAIEVRAAIVIVVVLNFARQVRERTQRQWGSEREGDEFFLRILGFNIEQHRDLR
jgi:hypothetical protein